MLRRSLLAQRRKATGFTQERLAEHLRVDRSTVARWESGETTPSPWLRSKLADALRISPEKLDELLTPTIPDAVSIDERLSYAMARPDSVDLVTVARLREQFDRIDARYHTTPSVSLLVEAGKNLGQVMFLRRHVTASRVRRELLAVEAEAATLTGQLVWDGSQRTDHATARGYFNRAVEVAQQLGDPFMAGVARLRTSYLALYGEKTPRLGLTLAMQAAETTARSSRALSGLATLHVAEAQAMLGRRQDCERSLGEAQDHFDRIGHADRGGDLYTATQHGRLSGSCYLSLNDPKRAEQVLLATAQRLGCKNKTYAIVLGNLSLARIWQRKFEDASVALHEAIDAAETTRGGGGLNIAFAAGRELRPWLGVKVVEDVYDRLITLIAPTPGRTVEHQH